MNLNYHFGKRSVSPCPDCDGEQCTMNCGPAVPPVEQKPLKPPPLPDDFRVICSVCGHSLEAKVHFSAGQLKKKHPRCRACAPNKFSNRKDQGGASHKESKWARELRSLVAAGIIHDLKEQVRFELVPAQYDASGKLLERAIFTYSDHQGLHVVDAKGMRTDVYKIKRKLMRSVHGIAIEEV